MDDVLVLITFEGSMNDVPILFIFKFHIYFNNFNGTYFISNIFIIYYLYNHNIIYNNIIYYL